jgi:cytochrome c biogenesis protein CcdA
MEFINILIDNYNIPLLTAFLLGILTSMSPCPLATNITAIAYISRELKTVKNTLFNGLFYTLGRGISYTLLATLIYFGISSFSISSIFEGWGDKIIGPILIVISLIMFGVININIGAKSEKIEKLKEWLSKKGYVGSLLLGIMFALAFCPYSGVLFFAVLMPLVLSSAESLLLPPLFALGTGLPVIIFSFLIAFSLKKVSKAFQVVQKVEKIMRYIVALVFMATGLYYSYILTIFLIQRF